MVQGVRGDPGELTARFRDPEGDLSTCFAEPGS